MLETTTSSSSSNEVNKKEVSRIPTLLQGNPNLLTTASFLFVAELYFLENDWKFIVRNSSSLDERQCQQQEAIWEFIRSELDYIRMLRVVCHVSFGSSFEVN